MDLEGISMVVGSKNGQRRSVLLLVSILGLLGLDLKHCCGTRQEGQLTRRRFVRGNFRFIFLVTPIADGGLDLL